MVEAGLMFKSASANTFNLMMRYMEMRNEGRRLASQEHIIHKSDMALERQVKHHNIEKIDTLLKKVDEKAKEAVVSGKRLMVNDFVCVKVLARLTRVVVKEEEDTAQWLRREKDSIKTLTPKQREKIEKEIAEIKSLEKKAELGSEKDLRQYFLRRCRLVINGMWHLCDGHMDMAQLMKNTFFLDIRILNYLKLRREARKLKTDISMVKKEEEEIKKHHLQLMKAFKELSDKNTKELEKQVTTLYKQLNKDATKVLTPLHDAFVNATLLFLNSALLLRRIIQVLVKEGKEAEEWAQQHEIPLALAQMDIAKKKQLLQYIKGSLNEMNKDLMQLSGQKVAA